LLPIEEARFFNNLQIPPSMPHGGKGERGLSLKF